MRKLKGTTVVENPLTVLPIRTRMIHIGRLTQLIRRMPIIHQCIIIRILGITGIGIMGITHLITGIIEVIIRTAVIMGSITAVHFIRLPVEPTRGDTDLKTVGLGHHVVYLLQIRDLNVRNGHRGTGMRSSIING